MQRIFYYPSMKATSDRREPIRQLITVVINGFYPKFDTEGKQAIDCKPGYGADRLGEGLGSQFILTQFVAKKIFTRVVTVEDVKR